MPRIFNGKVYGLTLRSSTKSEARKLQKVQKEKGKLAIITEYSGGYAIWTRPR